MNISSIKLPVEKAEGEQAAKNAQGPDLAFLQLLAALGLAQAISVDADPSSASGGTNLQVESPCVDSQELAVAETGDPLQEQSMTGGKGTTVKVTPDNGMAQLIAQAVTADGHDATHSSGTALAQAVETVVEKATVKGQGVTDQKRSVPAGAQPDAPATPDSLPQATSQKGEPQAAPSRVMDIVLSGHASKDQETASAVTPSSISLTPTIGVPASMNPETPSKATPTSTMSIEWGAVTAPSDLPRPETDQNSASAEHDGSKEQPSEHTFTQSPAVPAAPSLSAQAPSVSSRGTAPALMESPTVPLPTESPLPASVRFEVQPGDMGRIRVHLSVVDHTVYTNVMTERVEAHDFLVRGSERFEAGLASHGLDVGRFQVDVQGQGRQHADRGGTGWAQDELDQRQPQASDRPMTERQAGDRDSDWMHRMISVFA